MVGWSPGNLETVPFRLITEICVLSLSQYHIQSENSGDVYNLKSFLLLFVFLCILLKCLGKLEDTDAAFGFLSGNSRFNDWI